MQKNEQSRNGIEIEEVFIKEEETSNIYYDDEEDCDSNKPIKKAKTDFQVKRCDGNKSLTEMAILPDNNHINFVNVGECRSGVKEVLPDNHNNIYGDNSQRPVTLQLPSEICMKIRKKDTGVCKVLEIDDSMIISEGRITWTNAGVKLLLETVDNCIDKIDKNVQIRTKLKMWQMIAEQLKTAGYAVTPFQVESKYKSLVRKFNKMKNSPLCEMDQNFLQNHELLESIFAKKNKSTTHFDYMEEETDDSAVISADDESKFKQETHAKTNNFVNKKPTQSTEAGPVEHYVRVLQEMAADRRREHHEFMQFLREKEKAKDERVKRQEQFQLMLFEKFRKKL